MPPETNFCTTVFFSSLPLIYYVTWLYLYKMDFGPFGATPLALPPGAISKFRKCSSSPDPSGYHPWKLRDSSLNGLGAMVWHYRRTCWRTDGQTAGRSGVCVLGVGGFITISSLFLRDENEISLCWKISPVLNLLIACKEVNNKIYIKYCRKSFEPEHVQTNNKTCKISEEWDQPEQPRNLIRVFTDRVCLLG